MGREFELNPDHKRYIEIGNEMSHVTRKPVFRILWPGKTRKGLISYRD